MAPATDIIQALHSQVSTHDRGLLYGDGVFETLRCRGGVLLLRHLHEQRLHHSCERLGIHVDRGTITSLLDQLAASAPADDIILKLIVTRGEGGRGYVPPVDAPASLIAQWHSLPPGLDAGWHQGIDCMPCQHRLSENSATAGIKHLNRLDQVMASRELSSVGSQFPSVREGLMFDQHECLIEGTRSNLFLVINNRVCTPGLDRSGVAGVMRQWVLDTLGQHNFACDIRPLRAQDLHLASEMFICNSVFGLWPVSRIVREYQCKLMTDIEFHDRKICRMLQATAQGMFIP